MRTRCSCGREDGGGEIWVGPSPEALAGDLTILAASLATPRAMDLIDVLIDVASVLAAPPMLDRRPLGRA